MSDAKERFIKYMAISSGDMSAVSNYVLELQQLLKEIDEHVLYMPYEYSFYKNRIKELIS